VRDLATAVAALVPGTSVNINTAAPFDARSYRVDFSLYRKLAPHHQPRVRLQESIKAVLEGLRSIEFKDANFRKSRRVTRLAAISELIDGGKVQSDLRWTRRQAEVPFQATG
jgi:UDP-glucose 4-epimerase